MKGKRIIAGILLVGILATTLAGCKNDSSSKKEIEKPVITLGSDSYPPYNYLNEDGVPTGIDLSLIHISCKKSTHLHKFLPLLLQFVSQKGCEHSPAVIRNRFPKV